MREVAPSLVPGQVLVSIAAGVSTEYLAGFCTSPVPVLRVMPNTPALVGKGVSAVAPDPTPPASTSTKSAPSSKPSGPSSRSPSTT